MTSKSYKIPDAGLARVIKEYCRDLTEEAASGKLDAFAQAGDIAYAVLQSLSRAKAPFSVCVTAEPGMGASRVFEAVAQQLIEDSDDMPPVLAKARLLSPEFSLMRTSEKFRDQLEESVKTLLEGLAERGSIFEGRKILIAAQDLHGFFELGRAPGNSCEFIKPFAASAGTAIIALSTPDYCQRRIGADPVLARRFNIIPFVAGGNGHNLAEAFTNGTKRAVKVRQPLTLRSKSPAPG
jgi:ATP-dependent Clp protease ATP-binding subunit ClpA